MRPTDRVSPSKPPTAELHSPTAILRRVGEIWREDGPLAVADRILGETVYRRLLLFAKSLDEPFPSLAPAIPVECAPLEPDEVAELAGLHPDVSIEEARARLEKGHRCYVARHCGRVVHAIWTGFDRVWIPYLEYWLQLQPGDAYAYQSWTAAEYRGKGIATARAIVMAHDLRKSGYRRVLGAVMPGSHAALGPVRKLGYPLCGVIGYYRLGPWRRPFYRPLTPDAPGVRLVEPGASA